MQIFYKKRVVKNLGNYESIAIELGIEDKIEYENETYEEGYNRVRKLVNENLKNEFNKIGKKDV